MGFKSKLTPVEKKMLMDWIAVHGYSWENYQRFCAFKEIEEDRQFTEDYFRNWYYARKFKIDQQRAALKAAEETFGALDKENRIAALERQYEKCAMQVEQISGKPMKAADHSNLLRYLEQQRRILESIAKERGEYGSDDRKADASDDDVKELIRKNFAKKYSDDIPADSEDSAATSDRGLSADL